MANETIDSKARSAAEDWRFAEPVHASYRAEEGYRLGFRAGALWARREAAKKAATRALKGA